MNAVTPPEPAWTADLGQLPDLEIARRTGLNWKAVRRARQRRGIEACGRHTRTLRHTEIVLAELKLGPRRGSIFADLLNVGERQARRILAAMEEDGLIERTVRIEKPGDVEPVNLWRLPRVRG